MFASTPKHDLNDQLLQIADGDVDLVRAAIRQSAEPKQPADLKKVVEYILEHKPKRRKVA